MPAKDTTDNPIYTRGMVIGDGYEEVEHTADWSLRIRGKTMSGLLESGARGMLALMGVSPGLPLQARREIVINADDRECLLVAWLNEVLFELEIHQTVPVEMDLEAGEDWLRASVVEAPCPPPQKPIKAATFHGLEVADTPKGLEAVLVFDV